MKRSGRRARGEYNQRWKSSSGRWGELLSNTRVFAHIRVSKERDDILSPEIPPDEISRYCLGPV
jgi:hypothetical protein